MEFTGKSTTVGKSLHHGGDRARTLERSERKAQENPPTGNSPSLNQNFKIIGGSFCGEPGTEYEEDQISRPRWPPRRPVKLSWYM